MTERGIIFDIKRYAVHDGPGIRTTVFLKGCPLSCPWCHNPESQRIGREVMVRPLRCIAGCAECTTVCHARALSKGESIVLQRELCDGCMECVGACAAEALQCVGSEVTVDRVIDEVRRDSLFFDTSRGGVTFSGGEPLMQPRFLSALLEACRKEGIHTALDTSGYAPFEAIENILPYVDLFIYDVKFVDDGMHRKYTGVSNAVILENLGRLVSFGARVEARIPLVSGITDTEKNISGICDHLSSLGGIEVISLLPYHSSAQKKYEGLGRGGDMHDFATPPAEDLERIINRFGQRGFRVTVGG